MQIHQVIIDEHNHQHLKHHQRKFDFVAADVSRLDEVMRKLQAFSIAISTGL